MDSDKSSSVSVLVGTCDAEPYQKIWPLFDACFRKYWQVDCPVIFAGETIPVPGYETVLTEGAWGGRMLAALERVKTEYVIFFLEDYLLEKEIVSSFIYEQVNILERFKADKVMFDKLYEPGVYDLQSLGGELFRFNKKSGYLNSAQPAVWKTDYLKRVLLPDCSPWGWEIDLNSRTAAMNPTIILNNTGRIYFNFCRRGGRLEEGAAEFLEKEGLTYV